MQPFNFSINHVFIDTLNFVLEKLTSYNCLTGDPVHKPSHIHDGLPVVTKALHPMLTVTCTSIRIFDPLPIITSMVPHVTTAMPLSYMHLEHATAPPSMPQTQEVTMTMGISDDES